MEYYDVIPKRIIEALERYEQGGVLPGHFLQAVLSNDLYRALCRADDDSYAALKEIFWLRVQPDAWELLGQQG